MRNLHQRRGNTFIDVLVGVAFLVTLVLCVVLVMFVLLHTDWWPIFSVLLSLPLGYALALMIFGFGGSFLRALLKSEPSPAGNPAAQTTDPKPEGIVPLPAPPLPDAPPAHGADRQPHQHD